MKSFVCAMLIFCIVITGSVIYLKILGRDMEEICQCISELEDYAKKEDWNQCKDSAHELKSRWDGTKKWLMAVIDHREIDLIQEAICEVTGYCDAKDKDEILVKTGVLEMLFRHIPENEEVSLINILSNRYHRFSTFDIEYYIPTKA